MSTNPTPAGASSRPGLLELSSVVDPFPAVDANGFPFTATRCRFVVEAVAGGSPVIGRWDFGPGPVAGAFRRGFLSGAPCRSVVWPEGPDAPEWFTAAAEAMLTGAPVLNLGAMPRGTAGATR